MLTTTSRFDLCSVCWAVVQSEHASSPTAKRIVLGVLGVRGRFGSLREPEGALPVAQVLSYQNLRRDRAHRAQRSQSPSLRNNLRARSLGQPRTPCTARGRTLISGMPHRPPNGPQYPQDSDPLRPPEHATHAGTRPEFPSACSVTARRPHAHTRQVGAVVWPKGHHRRGRTNAGRTAQANAPLVLQPSAQPRSINACCPCRSWPQTYAQRDPPRPLSPIA